MTQATTSPATPAAARAPYRVTLHQIEGCNCSHGCGCQFSGYPDKGGCEFLLGGEVIEGRYGEVPLQGVRFVLACRYPGAIHLGDGQCVLFVGDGATPEQFDAIATILSGRVGGMPWEALAATVGALTGPLRAPIEMTVDGTRSGFRIPGVLELRQTPIKDPVSGQDKEIQIVYPKGGFMWDTGNVCMTHTLWVDHGGIRFEHPGGYACYAVTSWTNQA